MFGEQSPAWKHIPAQPDVRPLPRKTVRPPSAGSTSRAVMREQGVGAGGKRISFLLNSTITVLRISDFTEGQGLLSSLDMKEMGRGAAPWARALQKSRKQPRVSDASLSWVSTHHRDVAIHF